MAARAAGHVHPQPDAVLIVVDQQFPDLLDEAAGRTLVPQHAAAATPVVRLAAGNGFFQRLGVHVAVHQQLAAGVIGGYAGDQAVAVEFWCEFAPFFDLLDTDPVGKQIGHRFVHDIAGNRPGIIRGAGDSGCPCYHSRANRSVVRCGTPGRSARGLHQL